MSTTISELSNDALVEAIRELCDEVGTRLGEYLDSDDLAEVTEGLTLATRVGDATRCPSGRRRYTDDLYWLTCDLQGRLAEVRESTPPSSEDSWESFLAEHPELAPAGAIPLDSQLDSHPLAFTDEDALAALVRAVAGERRGRWQGHAWASDVLHELGGNGLDHSHRMLVVAALRRLEKAGLVVQVKRYEYGQRTASWWRRAA